MNKHLLPFVTFLKIGLFTIGGGLAMLPLIEKEVVNKYKWIDKQEFLDLMAVAQSMPGIFAFNFAILIGYRIDKFTGSLICGIATVIPSFVIILLIAIFFTDFKDNEYVMRVFKGMRPAVVALILTPVITSARAARLNLKTGLLAVSIALLIAYVKINPVYIILVVGIGSILYGKYKYKVYSEKMNKEES